MTRYILAGGCDRLYPEYLTQLARIIQTDVKEPKILSCWFSNSDQDAEDKFPEYKKYFLDFFSSKATFTKAHKDSFLEQIIEADVIYFHGGHTSLLLPAMEQYADIEQAFDGKIVVGSSAGANYISSVGFSPRRGSAEFGGALIEQSVVVHYGSSGFNGLTFDRAFWKDAVQKVREKSGSKEIILLPEGTFTIIDI